jgi:hypothetical protein
MALNSKLPYFYFMAQKIKLLQNVLNLRYSIVTRMAEPKEKFLEFYIKYPSKLTPEQQRRKAEKEALERTWRFRSYKLYCYLLKKIK